MPSRISYKDGNHSYWYCNDSGGKERVPSVTTFLGQLAKPALVRWAARAAADYATDHWDDLSGMQPSQRSKMIAAAPDRARNTAAAGGQQVHAWAEEMLAGRPVEIPEPYLGTVEGFARWWERSGFAVRRTELIVWSDEDDIAGARYAGRFDCLAEHPIHGLTLLDWKTGSGIWPEHGVQLAAYASADLVVMDGEDREWRRPDALAAVHIRPDGPSPHMLPPDQRRVAEDRWALLRALRGIDEPAFQEVVA